LPKFWRKNPVSPMISPGPNANANPHAYQASAAIEKLIRILATTVPAFFARENPISRKAKPACMNITRQPATITQTELIPTDSGRAPFTDASKESANAGPGNARSAPTASGIAARCLRLILFPFLARRELARGGRGLLTARKLGARARVVFVPLSEIPAQPLSR
jgi:hypothetical protein